jgi:dTDP-4-dehydrorhamnose 3,5-epimerase
LHFQIGRGTSKLVRCGRGEIFDVVVDLRRGSPSYGQWEGVRLSEQNMHVFYCPVGFAHGFCVLSDVADVLYKQSNYYADEIERGIAYDDPDVAIDWPLPREQLIVSERDAQAPRLAEIADSLPFEFAPA